MFIKSNKKAFNRFIPDENNINNFELDYFDIFNINRLSGFDRFDSQSRVDYGIKFKKNQQMICKRNICCSKLPDAKTNIYAGKFWYI